MTPAVSNAAKWTTEFLDSMRHVTDPEADGLARGLFDQGGKAALLGVKPFLDNWNAPIPAGLPAEWREFFERPVDFPAWVDPAKVHKAEDLFISYGPVTVVALLLNAVPHFFTNPTGARAFFLAKIFSPESVKNRMHEVPQFVINVAGRGGLAQTTVPLPPPPRIEKGIGVLTAQKLRIAHANIRIRLKLKQENPADDWDTATLGEPINQEDLAQALMDFWYWTTHGLTKLGIDQSAEEQDAVLHAWKVVGFLLGLSPDLQPANTSEAKHLCEITALRHTRKTPEATHLIAEMLGIVQGLLPWWMKQFPPALMRYQLGGEVADILDVPNPAVLIGIFTVLRPLWEREKILGKAARLLCPPIVKWLTHERRTGGRGPFEPGFLLGK